MELYSIETGRFRLDGGAMFGVVPRTIWEKTNPPDAKNRILMAMRCLLIRAGERLILVDNGIGHKYTEKFGALYDMDHAHSTLDGSLRAAGFSRADVTDLILTHLHFDHCGGTTEWGPDGQAKIAFPNARVYLQLAHFDWTKSPNDRERASFFPENIAPLAESGQLELLTGEQELLPGLRLIVVNGHTEAQQLPLIQYKGRQILFCGDLFPTAGHLPLPYVMSYDVRPLLTLEERKRLMPQLAAEGTILFFEHDPAHEACTLRQEENGRYGPGEFLRLADL